MIRFISPGLRVVIAEEARKDPFDFVVENHFDKFVLRSEKHFVDIPFKQLIEAAEHNDYGAITNAAVEAVRTLRANVRAQCG